MWPAWASPRGLGQSPHQDQLVIGQLPGPVGFGAIPLQESLRAVDLVLILPSRQTLRAGKQSVTLITILAAGVETTVSPREEPLCGEATRGPSQGTESVCCAS